MVSTRNKSSRPVFLVTGASSPIGQAISRKIALNGGSVAIHYQSSRNRAKQLSKELNQLGAGTFLCSCDLNHPQKTDQLVQRVVRHWGRLDALVNNASLFQPTPLGKSTPGDWERIFRINTLSPYFLTVAAFPWLQRAKGVVIHITDVYGSHPTLRDHGAYCASKAALVALTRFMAREMGPEVRVNAVSPGAITFPASYSLARKKKILKGSALERMGSPEDIASAVLFMAKHPFLTGQVLNVDGGRFSG
jgi:pteridine reductase